MKAKDFIPASKPRNPVVRQQQTSGAGAHRDKKKEQKQGYEKHKGKDVAEGVDIGKEWMSDTELDQYVPERLQQKWRELLGYDRNGNPSALWVNMTGMYEPDSRDPQHRALMVKVANKWFAAKKIPNVKFFDVRDADDDDELDWLVQIGPQGVEEGMFGLDPEIKGKIQNIVTNLSDVPGNWDHNAQEFTPAGLEELKTALHNKPKYIKYALSLTADDFDEGSEMEGRRDYGYDSFGNSLRPGDDEGSTEPPNNFAIYINGKKWKVFQGKGQYADDQYEMKQFRQLQAMAARKSQETGKKWEVVRTGEKATEDIDEGWKSKLAGAALAGAAALGGTAHAAEPLAVMATIKMQLPDGSVKTIKKDLGHSYDFRIDDAKKDLENLLDRKGIKKYTIHLDRYDSGKSSEKNKDYMAKTPLVDKGNSSKDYMDKGPYTSKSTKATYLDKSTGKEFRDMDNY